MRLGFELGGLRFTLRHALEFTGRFRGVEFRVP